MEFKKAERKQAKLRLALCSPAGGGKTYSALKIAKGMGGTIAMIDTEHGSGSLYAGSAGMPEYSVLELDPPFEPKRYIDAIKMAEQAGFAIIIIDSLTHAWAGEGGILEMHDRAREASKSGNAFTAWRFVTPEHNHLVDAMLTSKSHIIANMRSKQAYIVSEKEDGKTEIKKIGLQPIQREGMDYEFTVVLDLSMNHIASSTKDRTGLFDGKNFKPDEETGKALLAWLNTGIVVPVSAHIEQKPAADKQPIESMDKTEHWCKEHDTQFFMKGKMKSYGHPIKDADGKDTGKWCHEHTEDKAPPEPSLNVPVAPQDKPETASEIEGVDMDWLKTSITDVLHWTGALKWIQARFGITANKISEAVKQMTVEQRKIFGKEVQDRLDLKNQ